MNRREAAEFLGVSVRTVDNYAKNGRLTPYRLPNNWPRFAVADLTALRTPQPQPYLTRNENGPRPV